MKLNADMVSQTCPASSAIDARRVPVRRLTKLLARVCLCVLLPISAARSGQIDDVTSEAKSSSVYVEVQFFDPMTKLVGHESGSGFIVSPQGHFLTDYHVVKDWSAQSESHKAKYPILARIGGRFAPQIEVQIIHYDDQTDIAMLQFRDTTRTYTPATVCFRSEEKPTAQLFAFGFPEGHEFAPEFGTFSSANGDRGVWEASIPFAHGMSGGPVYDSSGAVVGLVKGGVSLTSTVNYITPVLWAKNLLELAVPIQQTCRTALPPEPSPIPIPSACQRIPFTDTSSFPPRTEQIVVCNPRR